MARRRTDTPPATVLLTVLLPAVLAVALGGCDLRLGLGTGLEGDRELEGRYEGSFTLEQESSGFVGGGFETFDGTIELRRAFGRDFSGDWRLRASGRTLRGDVEDGRVDAFDGITFELETERGEELLEALTDCRFEDGERRFRGSVFDRRLQADRVALLRCRLSSGRLETVRFRLSFSGRADRFF